jgi:hypothetical protein
MRRLQLLTVVVIASLFACNTESKDILAPGRPVGPMASIGIDAASGATIETNQDDYMPGELVRVTGHGWAQNETVHLDMTEDPDTHGDVTQDVQVDSTGAFDLPFYDVQDHDLGVTFTLTATGQTSGSKAVAVFTDGATQVNGAGFTPSSPSPNQSFSAAVTVGIAGPGTVKAWKGTTWAIDGGTTTCANTADHTTAGSFTEIITGLIAPAAQGSHTLSLRPYEDDGCSNGAGGTMSFSFTVAVSKVDASIAVNGYAGTYDGLAHGASGSATGANGEDLSSLLHLGETFIDVPGGTAHWTFDGNGSYNAASGDVAITIAPAAVTATGGSGSGTYTGATQTPSDCAVTGAYTGDLSCANSPATVGPDVGTTTITPLVSGTELGNFDLALVSGSYSISRAASTTNVTCPASVTYNGSGQTPCSANVTGAGGLTQSLPVSYQDNTDAGTATASASYAGDANHEGSSNSQTFTINQAPVTATAGGGSATYDGTTHAPSACSVTGVYTGDLSCANSPSAMGPGAGTKTTIPVVSGTGLSNFDITPVDGSYTIEKAPLTVTADNKSKMFDGAPYSSFTATIGGFVNGEDASVVSGSPEFTGSAENAVYPGSYVITPTVGTLTADNYAFASFVNGTLTIQAWTLNGFYQPVDMPLSLTNPVWNSVKNGSTVPLKFEVLAGSVELTDVGAVLSFTQTKVACDASAPTDEIEVTSTGGTSLRYDAVAGQFIQNWQTPKLAGQCYRVTVTTQDHSTLTAFFKLK